MKESTINDIKGCFDELKSECNDIVSDLFSIIDSLINGCIFYKEKSGLLIVDVIKCFDSFVKNKSYKVLVSKYEKMIGQEDQEAYNNVLIQRNESLIDNFTSISLDNKQDTEVSINS